MSSDKEREGEINDPGKERERRKKNRDLAKKTKEGAIWTALFDGSEFILKTASSIILARILFPEDYGLMGLASIAIQFARRFANFGFTMVLVQLKEIKREHLDTVFLLNMFLMSITTASLMLIAPYIADFFNEPRVQSILLVVSIDFIFAGLHGVPRAVLKRKLKFKEIGLSNSVSHTVNIFVSVGLALMDYGVWALVFGMLAGSLTKVVLLFYQSRWLPTFLFRKWALQDCFAFGLWVYLSSYISFGINKVDYLFIGKFLGTASLGFYEKAFETMSMPRKKIVRKMNSLVFSSLSRIQDDHELVVKAFLRVVAYLSVILYPAMIWLFFAAPSLITVMYGDRWYPVVLPMQIMCISGFLDSFSLIFQPLLHAMGMVGNHTRRQLLQLAAITVSVLVGIQWGIEGVAWGVTIASLFFYGLMLNTTIKNLPMALWAFFRVQRSVFIYSVILIGMLFLLTYFGGPILGATSPLMLLCVTILTGVGFVGCHLVIRFEDVDDIFQELFSELKRFTKKFSAYRDKLLSRK